MYHSFSSSICMIVELFRRILQMHPWWGTLITHRNNVTLIPMKKNYETFWRNRPGVSESHDNMDPCLSDSKSVWRRSEKFWFWPLVPTIRETLSFQVNPCSHFYSEPFIMFQPIPCNGCIYRPIVGSRAHDLLAYQFIYYKEMSLIKLQHIISG